MGQMHAPIEELKEIFKDVEGCEETKSALMERMFYQLSGCIVIFPTIYKQQRINEMKERIDTAIELLNDGTMVKDIRDVLMRKYKVSHNTAYISIRAALNARKPQLVK